LFASSALDEATFPCLKIPGFCFELQHSFLLCSWSRLYESPCSFHVVLYTVYTDVSAADSVRWWRLFTPWIRSLTSIAS